MMASSSHQRRRLEKTRRQPKQESSYENSVDPGLTTGDSSTLGDMGAGGTLQIWPKVSSQTYQQIPDTEQKHPWHHLLTGSAPYNESRDDVSTLHSYQGPSGVSHQPSMASIRTTPYRKAQSILHPAKSQPNFHTQPDGSPSSAKSSQSTRSQKLGLSKLFGREREREPKPSLNSRYQSRADERQTEKDVSQMEPTPRKIESQPPPKSSQSCQKTVFDRNPTENAKVHVRRPPKGIQHWFEGLDESDDDFPEVVQTPPEHVTTATFRPSLGPSRLRAAPTSRISPCVEPASDYFMFNEGHANTHQGPNLQEQSVLHLSSSEDEISEPPSPERWADGSRDHHVQTLKSNDVAESIFSMQTTMTSGSIPIMNADQFYRTPLPPMPVPKQRYRDSAMPAPLRTRSSEMSVPRATTAHSIPESTRSDVSAISAGTNGSSTHVMAVTQEEMVLLEMMRRKRAEMNGGQVASLPASRTQPFQRKNSTAKSIASSTISRDSEQSIMGTGFPTPPSADRKHTPRRQVSGRKQRPSAAEEKILAQVWEESQDYEKSLPATPISEVQTPVFYELEAPLEQEHQHQLLAAVCYSDPTPQPQHQSQSQAQTQTPSTSTASCASSLTATAVNTSMSTTTRSKLGLPPPPYNSADPYSLAPDLDFSPMDLLPLSARVYSPSLSTLRSSTGATSQFSAASMPDDGASTNTSAGTGVGVARSGNGVQVVEERSGHGHGHGHGRDNVVVEEDDAGVDESSVELSFICELDVKRNTCSNDVLAAWNALGGVA